ncbi:uncharacterized protein LOC134279506 [Saccostrea cucullata]|uniref:uncharacterized protein LOC134279506 n=1 Tax=Saccostrea cuccullata TaxID=36930 RepID=UPI002ED6A84A
MLPLVKLFTIGMPLVPMFFANGRFFCRQSRVWLVLVNDVTAIFNMAAKRMDPGFRETIFPLSLLLGEKTYKILVKSSLVKLISDNLEKFSKELATLLPSEPPNDPVYIDIVDDHVVVPQIVSQQTNAETRPSTSSSTVETVTVTATYDDEEDEDEDQAVKRFDWKTSATKKLLTILIDKKKETSDFALSKKIWPMVADQIKRATSYQPSAIQCREKFYSLKRSYRHFLIESKKTGNRRPKQFTFEMEMEAILENDPSFKPLVMKSSFGAKEINNNDDVEDSDEDQDGEDGEETASTSTSTSSLSRKNKGKKRKLDELKEFLTERDNALCKQLNEMQQKTNSILEKLVDKL